MWHAIFEVISQSPCALTKYEIADKLNSMCGLRLNHHQVYKIISYQWKRGNFSIYADWDTTRSHYVYSVDCEYYNCIMEKQLGV